jgi:2-polyprenyl-3-methyl-5-hydroxy-6-metoxy-1,4-benzoquinol methylase
MRSTEAAEYILGSNVADAETARLALLEKTYDPISMRRLSALDIGVGARCLEVGAGRGSIARWLSDQVGPGGEVVAADIDCRFLTDLPANVLVRQLDIRADDLEPDSYDLVHCRALLGHLPDPAAVVRRMTAALRPGGILFAEEPDIGLFCHGGHPDAEWATALLRRQLDALAAAKISNADLGRALPALFVEVGLELLGGDAEAAVARHGDVPFDRHRSTLEAIAPASITNGWLTEDEHARVLAMLDAPTTVFTGWAMVGAWGRRVG